jgi:CheY-like chemotaxis protein
VHAQPATAVGATVLVVDDEDAVRATTMRLLGRRGMRVLGASNGAEALDVYRQHADDISLVMLDMGMPVMSGRECFQRLRLMSQVPVLVATGYALDEDAQQLLSQGVSLLEKPFGGDRLMREVTRLLELTPQPVIDTPPSTRSCVPVTKLAASDTRNSAACAISSGRASR